MELNMKGKVAVIAGGSTGIGFGTAVCFLEEGCHVAVFARSPEKLQAAKEELAALGYTDVLFKPVDILDETAVNAFADEVAQKYGRIDYWVNVVGGSMPKPLNMVTLADFDKAVDINFKSAFIGCNAAARHMKKRNTGAIVNVSSVAAHRPAAGRSLYGCNKAALQQMTRAFAAELSPFNIRVNSISPGFVLTELSRPFLPAEDDPAYGEAFRFYLIKRPGLAREIGAPIVLLCSDAFGFTTASDIPADGGMDAVYEMKWIGENIDLLAK